MRSITLWYELIFLVFMALAAATGVTSVLYCCNSEIVSYTEDKTALDSVDIENLEAYPRYGRDLLASLINTDENAPYPNAIKIDDSPILKIDNTFHTKKFGVIGNVYYSGGDYKLSTKLNKPIKAVKFEVVNGTDVFHYYIDTTP